MVACYQVLSALALLQLSTNSVYAMSDSDPIRYCQDQNDCLEISVTQLATARCSLGEECEFEACVRLYTGTPGCKKNGDTLSHLCDESRSDTCPAGVWDVVEQVNIVANKQCQTGAPGKPVKFVYKDGKGCTQRQNDPDPETFIPPIVAEASVSCVPSTADTCTGAGNVGRECIWTVMLPAACETVDSPTCPTAVDFSTVTVDLANNIPCLGLAPSLFDVDLGYFPTGATEVFVDIFDDADNLVFTGPITALDTGFQAHLVTGEAYTIEVYANFGRFGCPPVELDLEPICTCENNDANCPDDEGQICCPVQNVCDVPLVGDEGDAVACGDPHMTGFLGQKFDFTGQDGGWYSLIADANMNINMRVTSPVPDLPEITYITGLSVLTTDADGFDHTIVIEAKEPHSLASSCPAGVSPCLADGSLRVLLDGEETLLAPGTVSLSPDVEVSAVNLPGACRSFGFEKYWESKKLENSRNGRRLGEKLSMGQWILADPSATNMNECVEYVARAEAEKGGVFTHQSEHASFQIVTPTATIRLSHGRLHQIAIRDPTDQYDLPDHLTWQMNMAVDHTDVNHGAKGILGETFVPTRGVSGSAIMTGMEAIRGTQEDYRVDGPLGTDFVQDAHASRR